VVLVNGDSASASEIVAGALQDHARAKIVGETSYGKGSVQTVEPITGDTAVKFTIAHYLTPKRRVIDGKGVTPDYMVKMEHELEFDPTKLADANKDTQLKKAMALLKVGQ
jgi:carboxyl-terminal processing protease